MVRVGAVGFVPDAMRTKGAGVFERNPMYNHKTARDFACSGRNAKKWTCVEALNMVWDGAIGFVPDAMRTKGRGVFERNPMSNHKMACNWTINRSLLDFRCSLSSSFFSEDFFRRSANRF